LTERSSDCWKNPERNDQLHSLRNFGGKDDAMADFTPTQGRYLAFIHAYTNSHGCPPAESEIAAAMCVSPPSVNQMVKMLEKRGLIDRRPGQPRSIEVRIPDDEIPPWNSRKQAKSAARPDKKMSPIAVAPPAPPARLYVLSVFLMRGPVSEKFAHKEVSRVIEIRGDQTLEQLHHAIFQAYDRVEQHLYEFQFGKRPFDPDGPNYGIPGASAGEKGHSKGTQGGDARTAKLDALELKEGRAFGYWFDFGDDWFHQVQLDRIDQAIPTVTYPRVTKRVGKSPPQYGDE
jgi:Plasmid pRiA4b ORF-3-like protein/LexA DNA binding domain